MWGIVSCQLSLFLKDTFAPIVVGGLAAKMGAGIFASNVFHKSWAKCSWLGVPGCVRFQRHLKWHWCWIFSDLDWSRCEAVLFFPSGGFALTSHGFQAVYEVEVAKVPKVEDRSPSGRDMGERNEFLEDWDGLGLGQFGVNTCFCGKMLGISTWCHFGSHMSSNPCGSSIHILFDEGDQTEDRKSTANCHHT